MQDPICKNGGYLRAENKTGEPTSCADCICPPEWDGVDCSRKYESTFSVSKPGQGLFNQTLTRRNEAEGSWLVFAVCTAAEHCPPLQLPDGTSIPASGCAKDSITPSPDEESTGKMLQCWCGGDDPSTQFLCDQQPGTNWDIFIYPNNASHSWTDGSAKAFVNERAGTYSDVSAAAMHGGCMHRSQDRMG